MLFRLPLSGSCGSSPRVWGTLKPAQLMAFLNRFIPTGVGNTPGFDYDRFFFAVHPHGCGEHGELVFPTQMEILCDIDMGGGNKAILSAVSIRRLLDDKDIATASNPSSSVATATKK